MIVAESKVRLSNCSNASRVTEPPTPRADFGRFLSPKRAVTDRFNSRRLFGDSRIPNLLNHTLSSANRRIGLRPERGPT
jgi:hypothetical protein